MAVATCAWLVPAQAAAPGASGALEFDAPSGLAVGAGQLWVTNQAGNSVTEIDPSSGTWVASFTRSGGYRFNQPTSITDDGPYLFVANASGSVTEMRASNGTLVRVIAGSRFGFVDPLAIATAGNLVIVLNAGDPAASKPVAGSITEVNVRTGALVRRISGASFAFDDPVALAVSGADAYVADQANNSVTEVNITNGSRVRVIAQQGLDAPDGLAVQDGNLWVADGASNSATEIAAATGTVMTTETNSDGAYGFGQPSTVVGFDGDVFIASPFGTSPMVTKVSATTGTPSWYMCNTNGPYYFSLLSAFAITGDDLWVASRSGANSETPGAATGSLTELSTTDGALITTLPVGPSGSTTTTSTTTTTTP